MHGSYSLEQNSIPALKGTRYLTEDFVQKRDMRPFGVLSLRANVGGASEIFSSPPPLRISNRIALSTGILFRSKL